MSFARVTSVLWVILVAFWPIVVNATPDATPPADWDLNYVDAGMPRGFDDDGQWELIAQGVWSPPFDESDYCVGIVVYTTKASVTIGDPPMQIISDPYRGWAWGYYATKKPDPMPGYDCSNLEGFAQYVGALERPGILFLHGNNQRGTVAMAATMAYVASKGGSGPAFGFSISAPGQGYYCDGDDADKFECTITDGTAYEGVNQISHGDGMNPPTEWVQGFTTNWSTPNPDYSLLWNYANSEMRAINLFDKVFSIDGAGGGLGFTNGKLVIGGFSAGGVTSLIVNGLDDRHLGVFTLSATAALKVAAMHPGSWLAHLLTADTYTDNYSLTYSFDCANLNPQSPKYAKEKRACQAANYLEPLLFEPNRPILLIAGAQDEVFPINALRASYYYYDTLYEQPVYRHIQADMDHAFYWFIYKMPSLSAPLWYDEEAYGQIEPVHLAGYWPTYGMYGLNRMLDSVGAFVDDLFNNATPFYEKPASTTLTRTAWGNNVNFKVKACWDNTVNPQPDEDMIRFNVSIDKYYHILPACNNEANGGTLGYYTFSPSTNYTYPTVKQSCSVEIDHCDALQVNHNGEGLAGRAASSGDPDLTCQQLDVQFINGTDEPAYVSAYVDLAYDYTGNGDYATSSGEVVAYLVTDPDVCPRREDKRINRAGDQSDFAYLANYYYEYEEEKAKGVSRSCDEIHLDGEVVVADGEYAKYYGQSVTFGPSAKVVVQGAGTVETDCDIVFEPGSRLVFADGDVDAAYALALVGRNLDLDGKLDEVSEGQEMQLVLLAENEVWMTGKWALTGFGDYGTGGGILVMAGGDAEIDGEFDVSGDYAAGSIVVDVKGEMIVGGSVVANGLKKAAVGGAIALQAATAITLAEDTRLEAVGDAVAGRISLYAAEIFTSPGATIETDVLYESETVVWSTASHLVGGRE